MQLSTYGRPQRGVTHISNTLDPSTSPGILASFSQRPPFLQDFAKSSQEGAKKTTILDSFYHFPKATNLLNCGLPSKLKKTATWPNILLEAPASQSLPSSKLGFCYQGKVENGHWRTLTLSPLQLPLASFSFSLSNILQTNGSQLGGIWQCQFWLSQLGRG